MKICLVSSCGGHLWQLLRLKKWWSHYNRFWVVPKKEDSLSLLKREEKYWAYYPEHRSILNFFRNLLLAIKILKKERPNLIFSTGAGIAPPFFIVGKLLGAKLIFLETYDFISRPTVSGKLVYPLVDKFLVQHLEQKRQYKESSYWGKII